MPITLETYRPTKKQAEAHSASERYLLFGGAYGGGKGHPYGTLILTPDGWRGIEELRAGEWVFSDGGTPAKILGIYNRGEQACYRFTFNDGSSIESDLEHLWVIQTFRDRTHGAYDRWQALSTADIVKKCGVGKVKLHLKLIIPKVKPIEFPSKMLSLPAYQLGLLLGDGSFKSNSSITFTTADKELLNAFDGEVNYAGKYDYRLPQMNSIIEKLGLKNKHSYDKFVPRQYLWNDTKTRLAVLQGLMDTDGYIDSRGHIEFSSSSSQLAEDVKFLVRSLGGRAVINDKSPTYTYNGENRQGLKHYRVYIRLDDLCPFRLKRKVNRVKKSPTTSNKILYSIEPSGVKPTICIWADAPTGLYVAQDFIVTHNTAWIVNEAIQLSLDYPGNVGYLGRFELTKFKSSTLIQLLKFLHPELILMHHQSDHYIKLKNGSVIFYGGLQGDNEQTTRISNMELGWFGIDQAEEVSEMQFLLLAGRLRLVLPDIHYRGLLTANPDPGWLRERFIEGISPDHRFIPALPKDNVEHLPADYEGELRKIYPPEMVKRLLEGDWDIDLTTNALIPYQSIREAMQRNLEVSGNKVSGLDISRYGNDETVFILRQGGKVLHIEAWAHQDTTFSAGRVARLIREHKPVVTNIDSVGLGAGVLDPLKNEGFPVNEVNVGEKALDHELYLNKRAEYFHLLAKKFIDGTIDIPDNPKLASQLAGIKYRYTPKTQMQIESKEEMRRQGGKSPDYADALMLAFIQEPTFGKPQKVHVQFI